MNWLKTAIENNLTLQFHEDCIYCKSPDGDVCVSASFAWHGNEEEALLGAVSKAAEVISELKKDSA